MIGLLVLGVVAGVLVAGVAIAALVLHLEWRLAVSRRQRRARRRRGLVDLRGAC